MVTATFRFYEELNGFIAPERRCRAFDCHCARAATAKHMIEALGVPHTEVELVLVNGESVGFDRLLADGDRVAVYPKFETFDVTPLLRVREQPLRDTRFVADAHLGGLAHLLRLTGFDTLYDNHFQDDEIERIALAQGRIVLTRDRELLKRRDITHGCYVHALRSEAQLREVFQRLDLERSARPFTRCLSCNAPLRPLDAVLAAPRVPPRVRALHDRFVTCDACGRIFWEGSHWRRMRTIVDALVGERRDALSVDAAASASPPAPS
ncbi:MAG TPA: Mut7-C RNAse domain-containing protein [Burkholderiaceae bacterium]